MARQNPDEPRGHRGHPTEREFRSASKVQPLVERAIRLLERQGFTNAEAIAFFAGIAHAKGVELGETWTEETNAKQTVESILAGRGAKYWSLAAIKLALYEVADLLK